MPIYEYKCLDCGRRIEKMQKASEAPIEKCETCGGQMEKQWSLSGFQFKGGGWYVTDYSRKENEAKNSRASKTESGKDDSTAAPAKDEKKSADKSTVAAGETSNQTVTSNPKKDKA